MRWWVKVLLTVSLTFNAAVAAAVVARYVASSRVAAAPRPGCEALASCDRGEAASLCRKMEHELATLRSRQGAENRRLSALLAADPPDREAIDACLDRLSDVEHEIQRVVVRTVLDQMATLPAAERAAFAEHVHTRLCDPFRGCGGEQHE